MKFITLGLECGKGGLIGKKLVPEQGDFHDFHKNKRNEQKKLKCVLVASCSFWLASMIIVEKGESNEFTKAWERLVRYLLLHSHIMLSREELANII